MAAEAVRLAEAVLQQAAEEAKATVARKREQHQPLDLLSKKQAPKLAACDAGRLHEWLKTHVRAGEKKAGSMRDNMVECLQHRPGYIIDLLETKGSLLERDAMHDYLTWHAAHANVEDRQKLDNIVDKLGRLRKKGDDTKRKHISPEHLQPEEGSVRDQRRRRHEQAVVEAYSSTETQRVEIGRAAYHAKGELPSVPKTMVAQHIPTGVLATAPEELQVWDAERVKEAMSRTDRMWPSQEKRPASPFLGERRPCGRSR